MTLSEHIPKGWGINRIIDLAEVRGRVGWKGYKVEDLRSSGPLVLGAKHISSDNKIDLSDPTYLSREKFEESPEIKVELNDLLFVQRGSLGKVMVIEDKLAEATINPSMVIIRLRSENHAFSKYLYYWLCSSYSQRLIITESSSTGVPMLSQAQIGSFPVLSPPQDELEIIAQILSTWDKAIEKTEQLIQAKIQLKKGLMQQLLTGRKRFMEFEGEEWMEYTFGDLGITFNGLSGKTKLDFGSGHPYIPYLNIINNSRINPDQMDFVDVKAGEKQNRVEYGDIFFTTSSETPGEAGMPSVLLDDLDNTYLNSFCFGFRLHDFDTLIPSFARFYFRSYLVRKDIFRLAQGSTRYNISKNEIVKIRLLLPSLQEQQKIASFLSSLEDELSILRNTVIKFRGQKKGLMQKLLTGEVRVNKN